MSVTIGANMNGLPGHLAGLPAGERLNLAVVVEGEIDQQALDQVTSTLREAGFKMFSPAAYVSVNWEGYAKSAVYISFENPAFPASGEYSFWPVVILGLVAVGGIGYLLWKAGDIAEDTAQSVVQKLPWILGIIGVIYLVSKQMGKEPARSRG